MVSFILCYACGLLSIIIMLKWLILLSYICLEMVSYIYSYMQILHNLSPITYNDLLETLKFLLMALFLKSGMRNYSVLSQLESTLHTAEEGMYFPLFYSHTTVHLVQACILILSH